MLNTLKQLMLKEHRQWIVWCPVFFGAGIAVYFLLPYEPAMWLWQVGMVAIIVLIVTMWRYPRYKWWLAFLGLFVAGFSYVQMTAQRLDSPILSNSTAPMMVEGTIDEMTPRTYGYVLVLSDVVVEGMDAVTVPKNVRITWLRKNHDAHVGDKVRLRAKLSPPPRAVAVGGYHFGRYAYFLQIGAVGFSFAGLEVLSRSKHNWFQTVIDQTQEGVITAIQTYLPAEEASIAMALILGQKRSIRAATMDRVRDAGLSHLLAISGMHLALVASLFFVSSRAIMALSMRLAEGYPIKAYACAIAMLASVAYLLLCGAPVSAVRACIMSSIILGGMMLGRVVTPLRSVALAAMLVLLLWPASIVSPGFQMSFAAVVALVSVFEWCRPWIKRHYPVSIVQRVFLYVVGMMLSSLIAGVATAPFVLYHFHHVANYGVVANMLAIPLTSFWVMPWAILFVLGIPVGLEDLAAKPLALGIDGLLHIATIVAAWPGAAQVVAIFPLSVLVLVIVAGLWLLLWKTRLRMLAVVPLLLALVIGWYRPVKQPDLLISEDGALFAAKADRGALVFSSTATHHYVRKQWLQRWGQSQPLSLEQASDAVKCDDFGCIYYNNGQTVLLAYHPLAMMQDCYQVNMIVNLTYFPTRCYRDIPVITMWDLYQKGVHEVYIRDEIEVKVVRQQDRLRVWE